MFQEAKINEKFIENSLKRINKTYGSELAELMKGMLSVNEDNRFEFKKIE